MKKLLTLLVLATCVSCGGTTGQALKDAGKDLAIKVADDVCQELAALDGGTLDPQWVTLACQSAAHGVVRVLLPRTEWQTIKARKAGSLSVDAGPGK